MKLYTSSLKKLTAISFVLFFTIFAMALPAQAQTPGVNGRILWPGTSTHFSIKPDGTDIYNTNLPTQAYPTTWEGVYAPNGQFILFQDIGAGSLYAIFATSSQLNMTPEEVTFSPGSNARTPAVSPDNTKYAFVVDTGEIRVKAINGSSPFNPAIPSLHLTNSINGATTTQPVWDPDGLTMYAQNSGRIIAINPVTSQQTTATTIVPSGVQIFSDVDPTGTYLLYTKPSGTGGKLHTYNMTTNTETQITPDTAEYIGGYYSPDGTKIVAIRSISDAPDNELVIMDADGSNLTIVNVNAGGLNPGVGPFRPFWSTDQTTFGPTVPTCTLTATPSTVGSGEDTTIAWTSTNATSISLDQGIGELDPVEEGSVTGPVPASVVLTATVTGPGGTGTCSASVTVGTPGLPNSGAASLVRQGSPAIYLLLIASTMTLVFVGRRLYKKQFSKIQ